MTSLNWMVPAASRIDLLLSKSIQARVLVLLFIGLNPWAKPAAAAAMYLLAFALIAVLPVPNRSYAPARRIDQSSQFGTFGISGKLRAGIQMLAGADCAGTAALK